MPHQRQKNLRVVTVRDIENLSDHASAWDKLAWDAPQTLPLLLPDWVNAVFRHRLRAGESWFCSFVYAGGDLVGVLPVVVCPHPVFGQSHPILKTPFDEIINSGDIALSPEDCVAAVAALLDEVERQEPGYFELTLPAVRRNSPIWRALAQGALGHTTLRGDVYRFSRIDLGIDRDTYLSGLGNLKRNLKRYRKKLEARGPVTVEIETGSAARVDFLDEFLALEASGWKGRCGTAILQIPSEKSFYRAVVQSFADKGRLEWHVIRCDGRVIAAEMGLRCGTSLMLPRIAFDEDFADCMPGTLLTGEVIAASYERHDLDELNHLSEQDWHRNWKMADDIYTSIHLVRRSPAATMLHKPFVAKRLAWRYQIKPYIPASLKSRMRLLLDRGAGK